MIMHRRIEGKSTDERVISLSTALSAKGADVSALNVSSSTDGVTCASNTPGYQFVQTRALILIESEIGLVAVMPIGMAQVASVVLSVKPGDYVQKGQELSYFQFGGSDIIMVFQKKANIKFSQKSKTHYKFGTAVASATLA